MDFTNDWNYIVDDYNKNFNESETIVQDKWEIFVSEILGYRKINGEILSKQSMAIGSYERVIPDIIIRTNNQKVFDIELKQYNLSFDLSMQKQLISYLKLLNLSLGLIVCQKIYLFYYDYNNDTIRKTVIEFIKNNKDGIHLLELLHKSNFDKERIIQFINSKEEKKNHIMEIERSIDQNLIKDLLGKYFLENYSDDEIDSALNKFTFKVENNKEGQIDNNIKNSKINVNTKTTYQQTDNFPSNIDFILIKTSYERVDKLKERNHGDEAKSLYDATRHRWVISLSRANQYDYVLSVIDGKVVEVYKVHKWVKAERWNEDGPYKGERNEFVGEVAEDQVRSQFIGKQIPERFRKMGSANPIQYSK